MQNNHLGIFQDFWDGVHPHHLPLLSLRTAIINENWNLNSSLQRLEQLFKHNTRERIVKDMSLLITSANWRPQLLFCLAILKLQKVEQVLPNHLLKQLWAELAVNGSFIIPQLAVTASIADPEFEKKAKAMLKTRDSNENLEAMDTQKLVRELSRSKFEDKGGIALRWKERLEQVTAYL